MAIQVTFDATAAENRKYKADCSQCGSTLEWLHADAKRVFEGDNRRRANTKIDCPACGAEVTGFYTGEIMKQE